MLPTESNRDPRYLEFFDLFAAGQFFTAHEVLERLWREQRGSADAPFYQALIQLAGAFVLIQRKRPDPALRLLTLAERNLQVYPSVFHGLSLSAVRHMITEWQHRVAAGDAHTAVVPALPPLVAN